MWLSEDFALATVEGIQYLGGEWMIVYVKILRRAPKHQSALITSEILPRPLTKSKNRH